jgi:hypothetical protein
MKNPRTRRGILIAVLGIGIATAIAMGAYHAGFTQGLATTGQALIEPPGVAPHPWGHHGHGFFFAPFFFVLLLLLTARALFWRRSWRGGCDRRYDGVPPAFEEWHRRAHEQQTPPGSSAK